MALLNSYEKEVGCELHILIWSNGSGGDVTLLPLRLVTGPAQVKGAGVPIGYPVGILSWRILTKNPFFFFFLGGPGGGGGGGGAPPVPIALAV